MIQPVLLLHISKTMPSRKYLIQKMMKNWRISNWISNQISNCILNFESDFESKFNSDFELDFKLISNQICQLVTIFQIFCAFKSGHRSATLTLMYVIFVGVWPRNKHYTFKRTWVTMVKQLAYFLDVKS